MNREPEIEYETYTVGTADMTRKLTLDGEIQYSSTAAVYPEIQAVVAESSCQVGQAVQEGDTLYVLDDADLQTQIAAVQSEYDQLDIQVRNTWGSEKKVNKVKRADAERRKADLEAELEKCTVTAPVSGVIISGSVREGQTVQKGAEDAKIVIAADHQYKIDIRVSQTYINDYKEGQEVEIEIPAAGRTVTGKIRKWRSRFRRRAELSKERSRKSTLSAQKKTILPSLQSPHSSRIRRKRKNRKRKTERTAVYTAA